MKIQLQKTDNLIFGANWSKYLQNQLGALENSLTKAQDFHEINLYRAKKKLINSSFQNGTIYSTPILNNETLKNSYYLKVGAKVIPLVDIPQSVTKGLNIYVLSKIASKLSKLSKPRG